MKNLKKLKNYEIWKIRIESSPEGWDEYLIVKNEKEAKLARELLGHEKYELKYVCSDSILDGIYMFEDNRFEMKNKYE